MKNMRFKRKIFTIFYLAIFIFSIFAFSSFLLAQEIKKSPSGEASEYYYRAKSFDIQGKYDEAIVDLKNALSLDPGFAKAHLMLGVAYTHKKMHTEAILEYRKSISLGMDPQNLAIAHHNLGAEYHYLGNDKDAEVQFKRALEIDPDSGAIKLALFKINIFKIVDLVPGKDRALKLGIGVLILFFIILFFFLFGVAYLARKLSKREKVLAQAIEASAKIAAEVLYTQVKTSLWNGNFYVEGIYKGRKTWFKCTHDHESGWSMNATTVPQHIQKPNRFIVITTPQPTEHTMTEGKVVHYIMGPAYSCKGLTREEIKDIFEELARAAQIVEKGAPYFKE